ncbi:TonB-dependent receptor [Hyphococcus luteus]|uniref:Uncharacterized protein n=1 Tax=Hyphococcus luteus TaxID=2058213 RepID=A0A2S7K1K4_9PROT|nr:TonB-dependent receptor [Marinicaulis flavus]PQA86382.1 hypothetical protein CW354_18805 [Marinicaulis flavus]
MKDHFYMTSAILAALGGLCLAPGAMAQEAGARAGAEDTIVVTARKRSERLEDVAASVSVLSEEDTELLALDGIADYVRQIPNATLVSAGPEYLADISIRGQGGGRQGFSESATGIYRNGIYVAGGGFGGRSFSRLDFFDVDRIETYRGPQGALYGRNAVGGAINVISQRPTDEFSAEFKAGYESPERYSGKAILNAPLSDAVAARIGAYYTDQNDGFIKEESTGEAVDKREYFGARGQLRADLSSATTANLTVEYFDSTAPGFSALGQRQAPRFAAGQFADTEPGPFVSRDSRRGVVEIDSTAVFAELNSALSFGEFTAIFSYKQRNGDRFNEDLDSFLGFQGITVAGIPTDLIASQSEDFERFGGEVRLASNDDGGVTWLIGADFGAHTDDVVTANDGAAGIGALAALATRVDAFTEDLTTYSAFGLVDFPLGGNTTLTAEARVQHDEKDFVFTREQLGAVVLDTGDVSESWTKFLPAITLSHDFAEGHLIYLKAASGYRPGGFNTGIDTANADFIPYDPETAYSFEAGMKGVFGNGVRYGLTGYYIITEDIQAVSTLGTTTTTTALQNVGDTNAYGVEAELGGVTPAGPGRLRWNLAAASGSGEFSDDAVITTAGGGSVVEVIDLGGVRLNRTRDYILSANAFYFAPLSGDIDWFLGGSMQAEGGGYENASGGSDSPTGRSLDHFLMFDARAGISGDNWRLSAYGKNLSDEVYRVQSVGGNAFYNEPRKYGVELQLKFGG